MTLGNLYIYTSPDDFEIYDMTTEDFFKFMEDLECNKFVAVEGYNTLYNTEKIERIQFYIGEDDATEEG